MVPDAVREESRNGATAAGTAFAWQGLRTEARLADYQDLDRRNVGDTGREPNPEIEARHDRKMEAPLSEWKMLHDEDGEPIWVNLACAMSVQRGGDLTRIMFPGGESDVIDVLEPPEEILEVAAAKIANG